MTLTTYLSYYIYLMALAISDFMVGVHVCQSDECTLLSPMLMN